MFEDEIHFVMWPSCVSPQHFQHIVKEEKDLAKISNERQTLLVEMESINAFNGLEGTGKLYQFDGEWKELPRVKSLKYGMKYDDKLLLPSPEPETRPKWRPAIRTESEEHRLRLISLLNLLETTPLENETLLNVLNLAKKECCTPYAALTLITEEHCVFKCQIGLSSSLRRSESICSHAILSPTEAFVVENLKKDFRFSDNPLVTDGWKLRFYAGIPLFIQGIGLGTLCVMHHKPMKLRAKSLLVLKQLRDICLPIISRNALFDEICYLSNKIHEKDAQIKNLQGMPAPDKFLSDRNKNHAIGQDSDKFQSDRHRIHAIDQDRFDQKSYQSCQLKSRSKQEESVLTV
eukprot:CAMPEP_0185265124 /NCGR_PEP_ID=MMETSP1359-20130426/26444_1 /TAXON_ID=552665 /ORGANISM="Bigelowiella longifila, Strain CCMP242" /LENGTH=346 /DNA_ID=CAMNT_0027854201 /DNA_START=74 /DNA_END=1114 /DNA_ORIENTATION=+